MGCIVRTSLAQRIDARKRVHERVINARDFRSRPPALDFNRFFAATDTLLDVQNILDAASSEDWPVSQAFGQLLLYGTLQALVVQQDATKQLLDCFGIKSLPEAQSVYVEIRDLRVSAVGHPHRHDRKPAAHKGSTFLGSKEYGSRTKFQICTFPDGGGFVIRTVDVPQLIIKQRIAVESDLEQVWLKIGSDQNYDVEHIDLEPL